MTGGHVSAEGMMIRSRRAESNAAIAARDAEAVVAVMSPDMTVAVAGGPRLIGRDAQRQAFAEQFADRAFRGYVRTPSSIVVHGGDALATEVGAWVGTWLQGFRTQEMRGSYVAEWRCVDGVWSLRSEAFT